MKVEIIDQKSDLGYELCVLLVFLSGYNTDYSNGLFIRTG